MGAGCSECMGAGLVVTAVTLDLAACEADTCLECDGTGIRSSREGAEQDDEAVR